LIKVYQYAYMRIIISIARAVNSEVTIAVRTHRIVGKGVGATGQRRRSLHAPLGPPARPQVVDDFRLRRVDRVIPAAAERLGERDVILGGRDTALDESRPLALPASY
jgi:hypothetical protein